MLPSGLRRAASRTAQSAAVMPGERYLLLATPTPLRHKNWGDDERLSSAAKRGGWMARGVKALVVACNTATSAAIHAPAEAYPIPSSSALSLPSSRPPCIGITAAYRRDGPRPLTLREEKFEALMHRYDQSCRIYKIPAPGLVELVERGQADSPEAESLLRELFAPYQGKLDEVVLGCTHYPFAAKAISRVLGSGVALLDGGDGTARETRRRLAEAGLLENGTGEVILTNSLPDESILELSRKLLDEK